MKASEGRAEKMARQQLAVQKAFERPYSPVIQAALAARNQFRIFEDPMRNIRETIRMSHPMQNMPHLIDIDIPPGIRAAMETFKNAEQLEILSAAIENVIPKWIRTNRHQIEMITKSIGLAQDATYFDLFADADEEAFSFMEVDLAEAIEGWEDTNEIERNQHPVRNAVVTEAERIKRLIYDVYINNDILYRMHHRDFEKMIAELLHMQGFDVELNKQTRDGGYDILALRYVDGLSPIKYLVQCKRNSAVNKVGVSIVREFKEVINTEQANKGIIVTSSTFTADAKKKREETPLLLDYKDYNDVIDWSGVYRYGSEYQKIKEAMRRNLTR